MDCLKLGCSRFSYLPPRDLLPNYRGRRSFCIRSQVCCHSKSPEEPNEESRKKNGFSLLQYSVTLTVISASLPQAHAAPKVSEKKRSAKKMEALSPEELKSWSQGLPVVSDRIPYTEILNLKEEGKLKHIIKLSTASLKQRPDTVLVVLDDSRVVRTVLPSVQSDERFWESWGKLQLGWE